ncbi:MAG: hypothetical protein GF315_02415 [candidate division Zixibacteria bacterium]|nr:hypothetical protein [candidate division Zixibacteria bacterium]
MTDSIYAKHPDPAKQGVNISKDKYDKMKNTMISIIEDRGEVAFGDLMKLTKEKLKEKFNGSIGWYTTVVKLDLEARGIIERIPEKKPQFLRLTK